MKFNQLARDRQAQPGTAISPRRRTVGLRKALEDFFSDRRIYADAGILDLEVSYVRKLVTELSGGVFGYLDSVLERHSFDEFGELI